jgi:hypothetical protein
MHNIYTATTYNNSGVHMRIVSTKSIVFAHGKSERSICTCARSEVRVCTHHCRYSKEWYVRTNALIHQQTSVYVYEGANACLLLLLWTELLHVLTGHYARSRIDSYLHATDLLVDVLHELNDEVNKLVLPHAL